MFGFFLINFNKINIVLNKYLKRICGLKEILYCFILDLSIYD